MALYEDGKIKFTDKWIEDATPDEDLREFLRIKRYNLADRKNSPYCTVENLLYNNPVRDLCSDIELFLHGSTGAVLYDLFINSPTTYITTVGMYNDQNELLAVAKLSKPLKKNLIS